MAKVTGIGGLFFRSNDPEALAAWYFDMLGVGAAPGEYVWKQGAGDTVFQPFGANTDYYRADRTHMINFRVDDIAAFVSRLEEKGVAVKRLPDETYGIFAHFEDPEGNPIELWQPLPE
ncbi:MAG: VOC family protein [Notoacmeibacter sp.]